MIKELKFKDIINGIIDDIIDAKEKSSKIHSAGDIRASGDEVEDLIREKISLFLPERYLVRQGHIVNSEGKVSQQFDIIIFDRLSTPKFFESRNKTVFYPIESVLAVGEIKKTLRSNDLIDFGKKIKNLKVDLKRELISNSAYGNNITDQTTLADMVTMSSDRKFKNPLFSFLFAIDVDNIRNLLFNDVCEYMPNDLYILNYGYYIYGDIDDKSIKSKIEDESPIMDSWVRVRVPGAICLASHKLGGYDRNQWVHITEISTQQAHASQLVFRGLATR
jgi:hypothetical protein